MSNTFRLGQFRKTNLDSFMSPINFSLEDVQITGDYSNAVTFIDKAILLSQSNVLEMNKSYYLNFAVSRLPETDQIFSIYLKNSKEDSDKEKRQNLYTYTITKGSADTSVPIEIIITPISGFDEIIFELQRTAEDYNKLNPDGTHGRKMNIIITNLARIENVLDYIGIKPVIKIGIQGHPGLLMSINGEEIRVGRSGIYEMTYDMKVESIGFVVKDTDKQNYFVMDYQY